MYGDTIRSFFRGEILENEPLSRHTTYRIGGPVDFLVYPEDLDDLLNLSAYIQVEGISSFILGGGSNLLVNDEGFRGVAVSLRRFEGLTMKGERAVAEASVSLDRLILTCVQKGLQGLENLSGIPGTVGGALRMNAGAFGASVSDHLVEVEVMDGSNGVLAMKKGEIRFGYRSAPELENRYILKATFRLTRDDRDRVFQRRREVLDRRRTTHPHNLPSAGSVFKRPLGHFAGRLIEEAGLKGRTIGHAQISPKHAGFIVNLGGATASDVRALIDLARYEVYAKFGVQLEMEQKLIGF